MASPQEVGAGARLADRGGAGTSGAAVDGELFRKVMGLFATGITIITTDVEGRAHGMTANAFMAGSLSPPLCVISVGKETRLHAHLVRSGTYGVSFLNQNQSNVSNHFAGRSNVESVPDFRYLDGVPVLARALAVIAAEVVGRADCGDHTLFVGRILGMEAAPSSPLVYFRSRYARLDVTESSEQIEPPTFW